MDIRKASVAIFALGAWSAPAGAALFINLNGLDNFTQPQKDVINQAKADWLALLTFNGGDHTIRINLSVNNMLGELANTNGWVTDMNGRVTSVNIVVNVTANNWTLGAPAAMMDDALDTMRHEFCHAIGWTVNCASFNANVTTVMGNRFYDRDGSGTFNTGDFDLIDARTSGTHAPAGSGDLMAPTTPQGVRNAPTVAHAQVLAHAFGFRLVPGPSTLAALGLVMFAGRRRRRA